MKASPLGKTVWARRTEQAGGRVQEGQQGHLELALGKHFHHSRVKMIPVSVQKLVNLQETKRGGEGESRKEGGCGSQSLCQAIQPLPSELRVQLLSHTMHQNQLIMEGSKT